LTPRVREVLDWYSSENPGLLTNLSRLLNSGHLAGTGRLSFLAPIEDLLTDPAKKFASNPNSYDPSYHLHLAIEGGLSAYIGSMGSIQAIARDFAGAVPLILNLNSFENGKSVVLATTADALRLGCSAVALSFSSDKPIDEDQLNQIRRILASAQQVGLPLVINITGGAKADMDKVAASIQAYSNMGAHIVVASAPTDSFSKDEVKKLYQTKRVRTAKLYDRVKHCLDCALGGKRLVLFQATSSLAHEDLVNEAKEIARGGGFGSMIGLLALQKTKQEAVELFDQMAQCYKV